MITLPIRKLAHATGPSTALISGHHRGINSERLASFGSEDWLVDMRVEIDRSTPIEELTGSMVTEGGDRRLSDESEAAHDLWQRLDQPCPRDFTITLDGE
jgi:hypothetical protein